MNDPKIKQKVADKIKDNANILVTVGKNPSVDELSAALGLTLLLNKLEKHATAVFSGRTPPAITFLDPEKTFTDTTDSLRDFIVALDKEKADHLRYKLEGDFVKIYITPFRSTITEEDLEFSQGDYNVELVIALGVENRDDLDAALEGHGQIFDDTDVITITSGDKTSDLGKIDWHDSGASSLSEMLVSLFETMKLDQKMLSKSIATAWLTGVVAATERFSNARTTSRAMKMSAQLMSAGADQQLIATKLGENVESARSDAHVTEKSPVVASPEPIPEIVVDKSKKKSDDGAFVVNHTYEGTLEQVAESVRNENTASAAEAAEAAEAALDIQPEQPPVAAASNEMTITNQAPDPVPPPVNEPIAPAVDPSSLIVPKTGAVEYDPPTITAIKAPTTTARQASPLMGGSFNATTDQAAADRIRAQNDQSNKTILSRGHLGGGRPSHGSPINGALEEQAEEQQINPLIDDSARQHSPSDFLETPSKLDGNAAPDLAPVAAEIAPTPSSESVSNDIETALAEQTPNLPLPPLPPPPPAMPGLDINSSGLPPLPTSQSERLGDILATEEPQLVEALPPLNTDPSQFQIPS